MGNKCILKLHLVIGYDYCTRQKNLKYTHFVASYIKYSHDQPQANTRTDRTHIRDSEHLAKPPKYRISLLTASCPLAHISHSCHHTQTWPIPSSTPPIAMWFSPFPSFLWLFMVVCFEFFSLWFSWHIYSTLESRRSLPSGRRKESQRKAVSSMRENSGRLPSPSSVREDKGGKER